MSEVLPERIILSAMKTGVAAISANVDLLDSILATLDAPELQKAKDYWTQHPPTVLMGYPRESSPFPCYALTLSSDDNLQDYVGLSEEALIGMDDEKEGNVLHRRITGRFTVFIYTEHPDTCAWYYRVLRRVMNVAVQRLIKAGLEEPVLGGADLAPDPRYTPENLYVRRLTLQVEYLEEWTDQDALWQALNDDPEEFLSADGTIEVKHEDVGGGVVPITIDLLGE